MATVQCPFGVIVGDTLFGTVNIDSIWTIRNNMEIDILTEGADIVRLTLILPRFRTGTVWFYTSTSNKRAARP